MHIKENNSEDTGLSGEHYAEGSIWGWKGHAFNFGNNSNKIKSLAQ